MDHDYSYYFGVGNSSSHSANLFSGRIFPFYGFVNITVKGTRYYHHATFFVRDQVRPQEDSSVIYREYFGHSTFEKDGTCQLMADLIQDSDLYPRGQVLPVSYSLLQPLGDSVSIRRTRHTLAVPSFIDTSVQGITTVYEKLTCPFGDRACDNFVMTLEGIDSVKSLDTKEIWTGLYVKHASESNWIAELQEAYEDNFIPSELRKPVPMTGDCLVDAHCFDEDDWRKSGDPSFGHQNSPYPEQEGELTKGVKAAIVLGAVLVFVVAALIAYYVGRLMIRRRFRMLFISRFVENVSLKYAMKDITVEVMAREFHNISKESSEYITQGELLNYLRQTQTGRKLNIKDFPRLWRQMDLNGTNQISFVEFCMFVNDCYREHSILRARAYEDQHKTLLAHDGMAE